MTEVTASGLQSISICKNSPAKSALPVMRKLEAQDLGHHQCILERKLTGGLLYTCLQSSGFDLFFLILWDCAFNQR